MKMMRKFFQNARRPDKTIGGTLFLNMMNKAHFKCAMWGFSQIDVKTCHRVLDIGCGGGKNIRSIIELAPDSTVYGIDYSAASVEKSIRMNKTGIRDGRVEIREASVEAIPYESNQFDLVTAFETIYFWPDIEENFREVARIVCKGGTFLVCNEAQRPEGNERWLKLIDMKIYTGKEIKNAMEKAGFISVEINEHRKCKWLCVKGNRPADL